MNILILEDELPAFKKLFNYISNYLKEGFDFTHLRSVKEAEELMLSTTKYDLIFSDIQLIGGTCFDFFEIYKKTVPIIFCTSYDEHLLKAFQINGISYILKPYSQDDIDNALKKYEQLLALKINDKDIFSQFRKALEKKEVNYKKRFAIKKREGIKLVNTEEICYFEANGDFCKLKDTNGNLHSISVPIGVLVSILNPNDFFRINRGYIVNINFIEKIVPYSKNRLSLNIKGLEISITTSTSSTKDFRKWIDK